ncbi:MAG: beta-glucosidase [Lachnospiraceae bacterium]|nr:beta-glucosidase [Lachnospiraceae bacterium]
MKITFPEDFLWGTATASAQIEGAAYEGGKGPSIWDAFSGLEGTILHGDTPTVACDFYHRYEDDIRRMKEMGLKSFRFSFAWARIIPDGDGEVNQEGIDFYKKMIACLKENGIVPNATMYHWDLPYALQVKGGFGNREIVKWFTRYAEILLDNFGKDIDIWVTFNEPIATYVGLAQGFFAPGLQDERYAREAIHNLLLCHGETVKLFRKKNLPNAKIGIVVDIWKHYPGRPGNPEDEKSALVNNEINGYGMFLNSLFLGKYSDVLMDYMQENDYVPHIEPGDLKTISEKIDFYGLNFYNGLIDNMEEIRQREEKRKQQGGNYQDRPEVHTEVLVDVLDMLVKKYKLNIPIYITENGLAQTDTGDKESLLNDTERIEYVKGVLTHLHKAMENGADVRGYYLWSLMDNFEWSVGYEARYGILYTDYQTQERIPKASAKWYSDVIRNNGFEV